jgi:hypothetical protein
MTKPPEMTPEESKLWADIRRRCRRCNGDGWIVVNGEYGTSAAYPCSHREASDDDRRMGVRFTPAVARHYSQGQNLTEDHAAWIEKFRKSQREKMSRPTQTYSS